VTKGGGGERKFSWPVFWGGRVQKGFLNRNLFKEKASLLSPKFLHGICVCFTLMSQG